MTWATISRIAKAGWVSFRRNGWLSAATIATTVLALFVISSVLLASVILQSALLALQDKIDVSVYFKLSAQEPDVLKVKSELEKLPEVKSVEYVSKEEALNRFRERHKENEVLTSALAELGVNPLEAALNIKAKETSQFASIASFLERDLWQPLIEKVNYRENKTVIQRLSSFISVTRRTGVALSLVLAAIAALVAFNTVRLAIYSAREEIGIMKLVGASNWFIRGPFIAEGVIYGVVASAVTLVILYPVLSFVSPRLDLFLPGTNILGYYGANLLSIAGVQTLIGVGLGTISSLIAIRRYLMV